MYFSFEILFVFWFPLLLITNEDEYIVIRNLSWTSLVVDHPVIVARNFNSLFPIFIRTKLILLINENFNSYIFLSKFLFERPFLCSC